MRSIQRELERRSQEVDGRPVLPNSAEVRLPVTRFGEFAPLLEAVTAELGEALVEWAARGGKAWYAGLGPFLNLELVTEEAFQATCGFRKTPPSA